MAIRFQIGCLVRRLGAATGFVLMTSLGFLPARVVAAGEVEIVLERIRKPMLERRLNAGLTESWLKGLGADGRWKDIDYQTRADRQKAYAPAEHNHRCRDLALHLAQKPGTAATLLPKLGAALAVNLENRHEPRFTWANDWYATHIAVPGLLADTLVLLDGVMPRDELLRLSTHLRDGLSVPRADGKPFQFKDAGQNLQWVARVSLLKAAVERDEALMRRCFEVVSTTIAYQRSGPEGIKVDAMFHQHDRQIYNGGYGLWYVGDMVNWFKLAMGTSFGREFKREQLDVFRRMLVGGHQWVCYRGVMDFGTRGRNISRPRNQGGVADRALQDMAEFDPANTAKYQAWIAHNHGGPFPEPGNRHFWKSDFMVHRGADWYCSVKMISKRTAGTETMNGENLLGHNLPLGTTCLMTHGKEYDEIYPAWDWSRLPGTTARLGVESPSPHVFKGSNALCGGVSDGKSGVLAFQAEYQGVRVSKAAFALGDALVCLTSGITCKEREPVMTSLNQCLRRGRITIDGENFTGGEFSGHPRWFHHDGVGYVMLGKQTKMVIRAGLQTGSWNRISNSQKPDKVERSVFSAWVDHGVRPTGAACAYALFPGLDVAGCARAGDGHGFEVVRNDGQAQAVLHSEMSVFGAVFPEPGEVAATGLRVKVDAPALVLVSGSGGDTRVFVGDPLCTAQRIRVTINGAAYTALMGEGDFLGRTVEAKPGS